MRLNDLSHSRFEEFFRDFYGDELLSLPKIDIYFNRGSRLITSILKVNGITIGRHIFIQPQFTRRDEQNRMCASKALIAHELTHAVQYQRLGFFRFLQTYLSDYWQALRRRKKWDFASRMEAYLEIPHEIEARRAAEAFLVFEIIDDAEKA